MNVIRQYTRDLSVLQRAGALNALERIKRDQHIEEFLAHMETPVFTSSVHENFVRTRCPDRGGRECPDMLSYGDRTGVRTGVWTSVWTSIWTVVQIRAWTRVRTIW